MVAPATLRGAGWAVVALAAAALIVALSLTGERPSLVREQAAAGVLRDLPPARVRSVDIDVGALHMRFVRDDGGTWTAASDGAVPRDVADRLEAALALLHRSAPQRRLAGADTAALDLRQYGLDPPVLRLAVADAGGVRLRLAFGARNPMGLADYARVDGSQEILLLSDYVLAAWRAVVQAP